MATGRDLRARLVLSLRDGASPGLGRIPGRLDRIRGALRRISIAAAVVGGLSLLGPMQQAAAFEDTLRQNAITAGHTGAAVEDMIRRTQRAYERLARETGQRSRDIAAAAGSLVAAGLDDSAIQALLPTIARVATATGSTMEDLAQTAFQLQQQMGLSAAQMPQAFAALVQAGRDGNFELRDMAREFPNILAMARALGMQGPGAVASLGAALQVARMAAGSSSEAANNVLNALQKLASPETRRAFAGIGVNLEGVLADAARQGINPLEAVVQKLRERTGGNLNRLSDLFGDRQALMGLLPLIQQTARLIEIRDRAGAAQPGIIDVSFADRMRGAQMQMTGFMERLDQLGRRFMLVAGAGLAPINAGLDRLFAWIERIDADFPGMIENVAGWMVGLVVLAGALGVLGQVLGFVAAGFSLVLAPLQLAFAALTAIVGVPVAVFVAAIALIAGAAYLIWKYWDRIGPWFRRLWATIAGWFRSFVDWVRGWAPAAYAAAVRVVQAGWETLSAWFDTFWRETIPAWFGAFVSWVGGWGPGAYAAAVRIIQGVWFVLATWFNTLWTYWVREPFIAFVTWVDGWTNGAATAVVDRIKAAWGQLTQWFRDLWAGITAIFDEVWGPIIAAIERVERFFSRSGTGGTAFTPEAQAERGRRMNAGGAQRIPDDEWNAPDAVSPGGRGNWTGRVIIELPPGVVAREANTNDPRVTIAPDRGATRGRP